MKSKAKATADICPHCQSKNTNHLEGSTYECYDCGKTYKVVVPQRKSKVGYTITVNTEFMVRGDDRGISRRLVAKLVAFARRELQYVGVDTRVVGKVQVEAVEYTCRRLKQPANSVRTIETFLTPEAGKSV